MSEPAVQLNSAKPKPKPKPRPKPRAVERFYGDLINPRHTHDIPGFRYAYHKACLLSGKVIVFGGTASHTMYALDIRDLRWEVYHMEVPIEFRRTGHCAVTLFNAKIYAFGGRQSGMPQSDVTSYDLILREFNTERTYGHSAGARWGASGNFCERSSDIVVFGGLDGEMQLCNDVVVLGLGEMRWRKPFIRGRPPRARKTHSSYAQGEVVFIYGGTTMELGDYYYDLHCLRVGKARCTWSSLVFGGPAPGLQFRAEMVVVEDRLFLLGGLSEDLRIRKLTIADMSARKWLKVGNIEAASNETYEAVWEGHLPNDVAHSLVVLGSKDIVILGGATTASSMVYKLRQVQ